MSNLLRKSCRIFTIMFIICACVVSSFHIGDMAEAASWRATNSKKVSGYKLTAKANLPYISDRKGGGAWRTQASYAGTKKNNKITTSWEFYSVGGDVSASKGNASVGVSGSGTSKDGSFSCKGTTANANGYVYGTGLAIYVGMISEASFSKGNTYYSISCKI